jgi:hypothetical protein
MIDGIVVPKFGLRRPHVRILDLEIQSGLGQMICPVQEDSR